MGGLSQLGGVLEFAHSVWSGKRLLSSLGPALEAQGCSYQMQPEPRTRLQLNINGSIANWQTRLQELNEWEAKPFIFQLGA